MTTSQLTLYNTYYCPYAARAVLALAETNQEHEVVDIDLSVPRPDWYLKDINPYGQVPALKIDNEHVIVESLVVAEYIANINPQAGLIPKNPLQLAQSRYLIEHWGNRTQPTLFKATITLDPIENAKAREVAVAELEKVDALLRKAYRTSEDKEGPFFLGAKFTFADLALATLLTRLYLPTAYQAESVKQEFEQELRSNKNLRRFNEWRDAISARPTVQKASAPEEIVVKNYRKFLPKTN
ncbi:Glutathione S-transferase protein [Linnemannia zychae]|nr:Glutathione S-transferase protein [Linnemannia zychae]